MINSVGEWEKFKDDVQLVNLSKFKFHKFLPQGGFYFSRITYLIIFLYSFIPLVNLVKREKPDYLIVQLITSLPLFLKLIFNLKTKIILRISGYPKMNFLRKLFWKIVSKRIHKITFPSFDLFLQFKDLKIFEESRMHVLYDPIISYKEVVKLKNNELPQEKNLKNDYILCVGRLTKQKNFSFVINNFKKIQEKYKDIQLLIVGEGELKEKLKSQIINLDLQKKVRLEGFQSNIYKYMKNSKLFILPSLWEEIGFVIVEAASCNVNILSSNCKNGPKEFLLNGKAGYLFENNNSESFKMKFYEFMNDSPSTKKQKKVLAKKETKKFTFLNHYNSFKKILPI